MTYEEAAQAIQNSPEGQAYAASIDPATGLGTVSPERAAFLATQTGATVGNLPEGFDGNTNTVATTAGTTGNFSPLIQQYYQELFNRQAQQPGLDYFAGRLGSGDLTEDTLRDAIIAGAQGQTDSITMPLSQVALCLMQHRRCLAEDLQGEHSTQRQASLKAAMVSTEARLMLES